MVAVQGERMPGGNAFGDTGRRSGGFILITGIDGTRYAVRQHAVSVIHDAGECHDEGCTCMSEPSSGADEVLA